MTSELHEILGAQSVGKLNHFPESTIGAVCSVACPGSIIIQTYDAIRELRDAGITVVGGFQSPMEKECLSVLLRGTQSVIVCPARSIDGMRVPPEWKEAVEQGRLLILSPFTKGKRVTAALAEERNLFVATIADMLFVPHASPGGKVEKLCHRMQEMKKVVLTINDEANDNLLKPGLAVPLVVAEVVKRLRRCSQANKGG